MPGTGKDRHDSGTHIQSQYPSTSVRSSNTDTIRAAIHVITIAKLHFSPGTAPGTLTETAGHVEIRTSSSHFIYSPQSNDASNQAGQVRQGKQGRPNLTFTFRRSIIISALEALTVVRSRPPGQPPCWPCCMQACIN